MDISSINHVALIMDGNGRWAQRRFKRRSWGHVRGTKKILDIVDEANCLGIKSLTLYAFSSENWGRPIDEVSTIFSLLKKFIISERYLLLKSNIKFSVIGDHENLGDETNKLIADLTNDSRDCTGLNLTFAFGYGSRDEIVKAVNYFIEKNPGKTIDEELINCNLMTSSLGDVDLLIRTGGDHRISNFLLWQSAYAELYFSNTMWPDFTTKEFRTIVNEVKLRERRFGMISKTEGLDIAKNHAENNKREMTGIGQRDVF